MRIVRSLMGPGILGLLLAAVTLALTGCSGPFGDRGNGLTIDDDVFFYQEDEGYSHETLLLTGAADEATALRAVQKVAARFWMVDATGVEHLTQESYDAAVDAEIYTPNWVAPPKVTPDGIELYVDCKGVVEDPMARTFRAILRQELVAAGVRGRVRAVTYE